MSKTEHSVLEPMMAEYEAYYERDGEIVHTLSTCVTDKKHTFSLQLVQPFSLFRTKKECVRTAIAYHQACIDKLKKITFL